jgi:hypothetical protein
MSLRWLVIPETDDSTESETVRGVVVLAWACGGFVALLLTAGLSAVLTVFGLGWVMVAVAGAVLALALTPLATWVPAFVALLAVAALTLPAVAVALSPVRMSRGRSHPRTTPADADRYDAPVTAGG